MRSVATRIHIPWLSCICFTYVVSLRCAYVQIPNLPLRNFQWHHIQDLFSVIRNSIPLLGGGGQNCSLNSVYLPMLNVLFMKSVFLKLSFSLDPTGGGILTEENGSVYEGEFHDNKRHGEGVQIYALVDITIANCARNF